MRYKARAQIIFLLLLSSASPAVTLETYLQEVQVKNGGVRGSKLSSQAKIQRHDEGSLFFRPAFFFNGEYLDDQRPTTAPTFQGTQTIRHTLRTGISQNLRTGTKASVSYNYYKTQINGASPLLLPNNLFCDVSPSIEISQSLWRNFLGSEFAASESLQNAQTETQRYQEEFRYKQLMLQAENSYWRLYFAQSSLVVQKESLERAKKLRDWNRERVRSNLVDESELLQAEANLQNREMEYQDTMTEVETALREFNSLRESEGEVNLNGAKDVESKYILSAAVPPKGKLREDLLATIASNRAALASAELGRERNKPNLELYGSYALNGRDQQYSDAYDQAASATRPYSITGLRFTTPLDFGALSNYKDSYAKEVTASELSLKRKSFDIEREWEILVERFGNFKRRLELTQKLEKVQEKKLVSEKRRYNQGRTTTFQVLQFEQDFANAQLLKLRNERDLITVYNQLKLFSGADQ